MERSPYSCYDPGTPRWFGPTNGVSANRPHPDVSRSAPNVPAGDALDPSGEGPVSSSVSIPQSFALVSAANVWETISPSRMTKVSVANSYVVFDVSARQTM